jgi:hypothetical protein
MRGPVLGLLMTAAAGAAAAQVTVDPAFRALAPPPPPALDLAPGPPAPPPALAEGQPSRLLPNLVIAPVVPGQDRRLPVSDLFGDGHSMIYGGEVMEDPIRDRRLGGAAAIPF